MKSRKRTRSELKGETTKVKLKRGGKRRRRHGTKEGTGTTKKKRRRLDSTSTTTTTTHKRRIVSPLLYSLSTQLWLTLLSLSSSIPNIYFQLSGQENLNVPLALVKSTIGTNNICGTASNKYQIKDWNVLSMVDCWLGSNSDSITSWIKYVEKMDLFGTKHHEFLRGSIQKEKWRWVFIPSIPSSIPSYSCISTISFQKLFEFLQFLQVEYYKEGNGFGTIMPLLLQARVPSFSTISSTTHYLDQLQTMALSMLGAQLN